MSDLKVLYVPASQLKPYGGNPRKWDVLAVEQLTASIQKFGLVDPIIVNSAPGREDVVLGGNFRLKIAKDLGIKEIPVIYLRITDIEKEKELVIRLNKNVGDWDYKLLAEFDPSLLEDVGFTSEEMDEIIGIDETPEVFDLKKELDKLNIKSIEVQKGDVWQLGDHRLMCGDSTTEADVLKLMGNEKADMCFTDPPYLLDYLSGKKKHGKATEGFGFKRDRRYLETDILLPNFTTNWMANVAKIQKPDFSIIIFENPKNLRTIWNELEKHWRWRNTITWFVPTRNQGFAAKYKFFSKTDIALVGTAGEVELNTEPEEELFQNEYENALFATSGKPHWEGYEKGKQYQPTDFIQHNAVDAKSSQQGIIFGTKPLEVLIPYLKVLTKRGDLVIEPFGGSGSTLIACEKMGRRCYLMEKVPTYAQVIINRWERLSGRKAVKL
jgi:DNA modification methylase